MDVADRIVIMNQGHIEQVGPPRELYESPTNSFVMGFLGPVARLGRALVRPHDLQLSVEPAEGAREAMVARVVHLGFEVRAELVLGEGEELAVQLTRDEAEQLELSDGDIVWVAHAGASDGAAGDQRVSQASGSAASFSTPAGSWPAATSASVTSSTTLRKFARTAIHTCASGAAAPS